MCRPVGRDVDVERQREGEENEEQQDDERIDRTTSM